MMNANARAWVAALRSGEFTQGFRGLRTGEAYCCLGVACEVYRRATRSGTWSQNWFNGYNDALPNAVREWLGLKWEDGGSHKSPKDLIDLNDADRLTFEQIADLIESEPPGMFEDEGET